MKSIKLKAILFLVALCFIAIYQISCTSRIGSTVSMLSGTGSLGSSGPGGGANQAVISRPCPGTPMSLGANASLNGFLPFPSSNAWNTNIASYPVDPNSATIVASADFTGHLHHDFSSVGGGNYGIPFMVVDSSQTPLVTMGTGAYPGESDVTLEPIPANAPIEGNPGQCAGGPNNYIGDQHVLILDRNTCMLYETWNTTVCNGTWSSDSQTIWDMKNGNQRPLTWTSADAAGLSVFAGLLRYDEVASGAIHHAIRYTMSHTKADANTGYFIYPATHAAPNNWGTVNVMGMRLRLKASFDISGYSQSNQVILTAMKQYGMILADNGSNFFYQGAPDARWDDNDLANLDSIGASNFEVVNSTPAYPGYDSASAPTGPSPTIGSFTASSNSVSSGTAVTLSWNTSNDSYDFIDVLGPVFNGTVTVVPTATTTYTLNATNQYGRSTQAVTITVH